MRYHAPADPEPDRAMAGDPANWLQSRPLTSTTSLDLVDQLARFWHDDDARTLRRAGADLAPWMVAFKR